jgi:hypothetical protein
MGGNWGIGEFYATKVKVVAVSKKFRRNIRSLIREVLFLKCDTGLLVLQS